MAAGAGTSDDELAAWPGVFHDELQCRLAILQVLRPTALAVVDGVNAPTALSQAVQQEAGGVDPGAASFPTAAVNEDERRALRVFPMSGPDVHRRAPGHVDATDVEAPVREEARVHPCAEREVGSCCRSVSEPLGAHLLVEALASGRRPPSVPACVDAVEKADARPQQGPAAGGAQLRAPAGSIARLPEAAEAPRGCTTARCSEQGRQAQGDRRSGVNSKAERRGHLDPACHSKRQCKRSCWVGPSAGAGAVDGECRSGMQEK